MITNSRATPPHLLWLLLLAILFWPSICKAQIEIRPNQLNLGDPFALTGAVTSSSLNNDIYASGVGAGDCGSRVTMAAALLAGPGRIVINAACGAFKTPFSLGTKQVLYIIQPGTYLL